jgi:hypothetical protein
MKNVSPLKPDKSVNIISGSSRSIRKNRNNTKKSGRKVTKSTDADVLFSYALN